MTIRPVEPSEYEAAGELVVAAYRGLRGGAESSYDVRLRDIAARARSSEVLVAEEGGRIVGCVTFVDALGEMSESDDPDAASIRMLAVAGDARGRGVGEALVRECLDRARRAGRARMRLHTEPGMAAAQRIYERLGFRRDPEHDWEPAPGVRLLAYVSDLGPAVEADRVER